MSVSVRELRDGVDRETFVRLVNTATPDDPTSLDYLDWEDATYPGGTRLIATMGGKAVGAASVGRIFMHPPEFDGLWASMGVLAGSRRRGVGSHLLDALMAVAQERGKGYLHMPTSEERPEAIEFLAHRGFTELERYKMVRLDLADLAVPTPTVPDGVTLTTLGERPDLVAGVHAVAQATFADIPSADEPIAAGDLAEFRARDVDKLPGWGFVVAVDDATGDAVGYASLYERLDGAGVYWHDMTAVLPAWRGRGLATALKVGTIRAAIEHGAVALETGNDTANAPMRAVNARLGYRPLPDSVTMRGPVARGMNSVVTDQMDAVAAADEAASESERVAPPAPETPPAPEAEAEIEPEVYEERRNVIARDKGLPGEVITGGEDPDPVEGLREERFYGRLLVAMVAVLILGGFVIGLLIALAQA